MDLLGKAKIIIKNSSLLTYFNGKIWIHASFRTKQKVASMTENPCGSTWGSELCSVQTWNSRMITLSSIVMFWTKSDSERENSNSIHRSWCKICVLWAIPFVSMFGFTLKILLLVVWGQRLQKEYHLSASHEAFQTQTTNPPCSVVQWFQPAAQLQTQVFLYLGRSVQTGASCYSEGKEKELSLLLPMKQEFTQSMMAFRSNNFFTASYRYSKMEKLKYQHLSTYEIKEQFNYRRQITENIMQRECQAAVCPTGNEGDFFLIFVLSARHESLSFQCLFAVVWVCWD